jgi:hypothetical protein
MLRSQTENAQNESAAAASHTAAIMSLNLKLQSTASRNQARNTDHELRRIEANESKELLDIIQVISDILAGALFVDGNPRSTAVSTPNLC